MHPMSSTHKQIDTRAITNVIQIQFGLKFLGFDYLACKKSYPKLNDSITILPKGYKVPDFKTFFGDVLKFTMEHIGKFTAQYSAKGQ